MGMCALWGSPERGGKGVYFALFLRLRVSVRSTAAPVIEPKHRAAHRPSLDSSAVRGEVLVVEVKVTSYIFHVVNGVLLE